jgi:hypothetical protein
MQNQVRRFHLKVSVDTVDEAMNAAKSTLVKDVFIDTYTTTGFSDDIMRLTFIL